MNVLRPRRAHPVALVFCLAFYILAFAVAERSARAQSKPTPTPTPAAPATPQGTDANGVVLVNTDLITLTVTVTDAYGRYVSGLEKKHFTVFDDKTQQEITFFSDDDAPVSVGVIFDMSGSMSGDKIRKAREALARFIQTSHERDEYFLVGFNNRAQLLLDRTRDGNSVLNKLTFIEPKSNTALYDACYLGVEKVSRGTHQKRALLLISDGQDNDSRYTFSEVRRLLKESDVVLYSIGILGGGDPNSSLGLEGQAILDELSSVSGGKAFFPNSAPERSEERRVGKECRSWWSPYH